MLNYAYNYASIDIATKMCIQVITDTNDLSNSVPAGEMYIPIPEYSEEYLLKYYDESTGKWYYDAEMTNEWTPPTE